MTAYRKEVWIHSDEAVSVKYCLQVQSAAESQNATMSRTLSLQLLPHCRLWDLASVWAEKYYFHKWNRWEDFGMTLLRGATCKYFYNKWAHQNIFNLFRFTYKLSYILAIRCYTRSYSVNVTLGVILGLFFLCECMPGSKAPNLLWPESILLKNGKDVRNWLGLCFKKVNNFILTNNFSLFAIIYNDWLFWLT